MEAGGRDVKNTKRESALEEESYKNSEHWGRGLGCLFQVIYRLLSSLNLFVHHKPVRQIFFISQMRKWRLGELTYPR